MRCANRPRTAVRTPSSLRIRAISSSIRSAAARSSRSRTLTTTRPARSRPWCVGASSQCVWAARLGAEALPVDRDGLSHRLSRSTTGERRDRGGLRRREGAPRAQTPPLLAGAACPSHERAAGRERRRHEHLEVDVVDRAVALDEDGLRVVAHHVAAEEPIAVLFLGGKVEARCARRAGFAIAPKLGVARGCGLYGLVEIIVAPAADGNRGPVERVEDRLDQARLARAPPALPRGCTRARSRLVNSVGHRNRDDVG